MHSGLPFSVTLLLLWIYPATRCRLAAMEDASLDDIIQQNEVATMLRNARLTLQAPESAQRMEEAGRQVRQAMYKATLAQISQQERDQVLEMLRPCCPEVFSSDVKPDDDWPVPPPLSDQPLHRTL